MVWFHHRGIRSRGKIKFFNNVIRGNSGTGPGERNHASKHSSRPRREMVATPFYPGYRGFQRLFYSLLATLNERRISQSRNTLRPPRPRRSMNFRKRISCLNGRPRNYSFWRLGLTVELNAAIAHTVLTVDIDSMLDNRTIVFVNPFTMHARTLSFKIPKRLVIFNYKPATFAIRWILNRFH